MRSLVWYRNDLRVADQPALAAAMDDGEAIACFCVAHRQWRQHDMSDWRIAFLLRCLQALQEDLASLNVPLLILDAPWFEDAPGALLDVCRRLGIDQVHFNDEYPLDERRRDDAVVETLLAEGVASVRHHADVALPPGKVLTGAGEPYGVYSPFYRNWIGQLNNASASLTPLPSAQTQLDLPAGAAQMQVPTELDGVKASFGSDRWPAGEAAARNALEAFVADHIAGYHEQRDFPAVSGTSGLSHHLAVGTLSVMQGLDAARRAAQDPGCADGAEHWIKELAWRDFYRHVIAQNDGISMGRAFKPDTEHLPWRDAPQELAAWQAGETGYPLVDAAMRQLNETGWMHNRLRMVAAMFLTKHLLIDWHEGERYFMQHLIDGDFASNNGGWQWSASTGTDAAPYFRIFNPATQGTRFDAQGKFTRHWVPALADVPDKHLFEPHKSGVSGYPEPIVEHKFARERALEFFQAKL